MMVRVLKKSGADRHFTRRTHTKSINRDLNVNSRP